MTDKLKLPVPQSGFEQLRRQLRGRLALPGERGYDVARPWNLALATHPAAVVVAADVEDVQRAVRWAAENTLRVAVHATGHGSVGQGSDVLVIHTGRLQGCVIVIDVVRRTARIEAGVLAQQLLDAAHEFGLAPVLGSAGTVGVAGYLSGGGIGPLVSTFGLSADYVRSLDVVTADGAVQRAGPDENPDLYWAARGGKAAVGIITAVELDLLDLSTVYGGTLHFAAFDAADIASEWARWSAQLPEMATTSLALMNMPDDPSLPPHLAGRFIASLRFATPAGPDEAEDLLADMRRVAAPLVDTITSMPYRALAGAYGGPRVPVPVHQDQRLLTSLTEETVRAILGAAGPDSGSRLAEVDIRRLGGALARPPRHPSAFSHRDSPYSLGVTGILTEPGTATPHSATATSADRLFTAVRTWSNGATLANFVDTTDPARIARSYDSDTVHRIRAIAETRDPDGIFAVAGELAPERDHRLAG